MALSELMRELAAELGMSDIELEEDGGAQIVVDDDFAIDIAGDEAGPGFTVSATVGIAPTTEREATFAALLEANLVGQGTGGATLALDPVLDEVVLCRSFSRDDLPFEEFEQELVAFIEALRLWRGRHAAGLIATGETEADDASSTQPPQGPPGPGMIRI